MHTDEAVDAYVRVFDEMARGIYCLGRHAWGLAARLWIAAMWRSSPSGDLGATPLTGRRIRRTATRWPPLLITSAR